MISVLYGLMRMRRLLDPLAVSRGRLRLRPFATLLTVAAGLVLLAPAARAEVRIVVQADGTRVVRNVGGTAAGAASHRASMRRSDATRAGGTAQARRPAPSPELSVAITEHATALGIDPRLVEAVIQAESAWNRRAVSRTGAMGLMQLMPQTAVELAVDDPWDAAQNVRGGTAYLARQLERFGSPELALAAYNAGPEAVKRYDGIPPYAETREYVRRVLSLYRGRTVTRGELAPFLGHAAAGGDSAVTSRGTAPGFVRRDGGRLTLTNVGGGSRADDTALGG